MAGSLNRVTLIGNLGKDPDARTVLGDRTVTKFPLATTETWVKDGEKKEKTEWHNIVVWGKLAEICQKYLQKGRQVYVQGSLRTHSYDDSEGRKKYITEIIADEVLFLGSPADGATRANAEAKGKPQKDDDIPF